MIMLNGASKAQGPGKPAVEDGASLVLFHFGPREVLLFRIWVLW